LNRMSASLALRDLTVPQSLLTTDVQYNITHCM